MSGHSHAKTVKRVKDANDAKRGKVFSKIARMISVAAKDGGDPETNSKLRQALDEAKRFNMPKDNVERAIKRGTGEEEGEQLEEVMYEAIGPANVAIIMEGITDNKNRTLAEIRQILQKNNAKLADEGSMKYQFVQKGIIILVGQNKEKIEMSAIEAGAEDMLWQKHEDQEVLEVITNVENLENVKQNLEKQNIEIQSSTLGWIPKTEIETGEKEKTACVKLFDELDESEAIQEIYSNLKV